MALAYVSDVQVALDADGAVVGLVDHRAEAAGFRMRVLGKQAYLIYEPIPWISDWLFLSVKNCEPII